MRTISVLLLCIAVNLANLHAQITTIDGVISFQEKMDTTEYKIVSDSLENILIKKNKDFYYIGIHNSTLYFTNIILKKGREFLIIHISACTGRAIYHQVSDDSLKVIKPILNVSQHPGAWDVLGRMVTLDVMKFKKSKQQMIGDMQKCLNKFGYMANTIDMGSYHDVEVLLDKKVFQGYKMLVQYADLDTCPEPARLKMKLYPNEGYSDDMERMQIFLNAAERTSLKIKMSLEKWIEL